MYQPYLEWVWPTLLFGWAYLLFVWDMMFFMIPTWTVVVVIVIIFVYNVVHALRLWMRRAKEMDPNANYTKEMFIVSDAITEGIEEAVFQGRLTRKQAKYWYKLISDKCRLWDLAKVETANPELNKRQQFLLKEKLEAAKEERKTQPRKVVTLPGQ